MEQYTNVISDYFSNSVSVDAMKFIGSVIDSIPNLSIITQLELLCWKTDNTIEKNVESFINDSLIFNINQEVINHCVNLRRNKKIKTPDAIIAATALTQNYALIPIMNKILRVLKA